MASPSDPCVPSVPFCWTGWHEEIDGCIHPYDEGVHRATVMAYVAREVGVDFADVSCRVRYARVLTRQEAWDQEGGRDLFEDEWLAENKVGFYFDTNDYRYDGILADGSPRPQDDLSTPASGLKKAEPPFPVSNPPADWDPPGGISVVRFVDDPTLSYPTRVERVLVCSI